MTPAFRGPDHANPESFLRSFCADYKLWNDQCFKADRAARRLGDVFDGYLAGSGYAALLALYTDGKSGSYSYGTRATFEPDGLRIIDIDARGDRVTLAFHIDGSDFRAVLRKAPATFLLSQLDFISDDGAALSCL